MDGGRFTKKVMSGKLDQLEDQNLYGLKVCGGNDLRELKVGR